LVSLTSFDKKILEKKANDPNLFFLKQIYRSLARGLRKLSRMALTLELYVLWLAISLEK
jgi:hypothetical protein